MTRRAPYDTRTLDEQIAGEERYRRVKRQEQRAAEKAERLKPRRWIDYTHPKDDD